jgi:hypothetical protein
MVNIRWPGLLGSPPGSLPRRLAKLRNSVRLARAILARYEADSSP